MSKTMPKRIQRKRVRGWRMPPNTVYVGRPTKWGNPYSANPAKVDDLDWLANSQAEAVELFRLLALAGGVPDISALRGKNLACFCPLDKPCHGDVLLRLANPPEDDLACWRSPDQPCHADVLLKLANPEDDRNAPRSEN